MGEATLPLMVQEMFILQGLRIPGIFQQLRGLMKEVILIIFKWDLWLNSMVQLLEIIRLPLLRPLLIPLP